MPSEPSATEPAVNGGRHVTVSFSARGLLVVGAALVLGWAVVSAASAIFVIVISVFAALVLDPPVTALAKRTGMSRGRAATLTVFGLVAGGLLITLALLIPLLRELRDLIQDLPQIVSQIRDSDAFHWLDEQVDVGSQSQAHASDIAARVPDTLEAFVGIAGHVFGFFFLIFELIFLTLFLLCDLPKFSDSIEGMLYPESAGRYHRLREQITTTISRYAVGAVAIASIAGTVMGLTAWLVGAPYPLALGLIAGLLDLIPQIGATIAGVILTLVTLPQGVPQALIMLAVVLIYQQAENYVLQPTIQGKAAAISGFLVIASVLVFGSILGVIGALFAVPFTAAAQIILRELTAERRARIAEAKAALDVQA
jgi:predicted PurR-regulated permease PerM